jgi:hypothetical protein
VQPTKPFELASPSTQAWWSCPGLLYFLGVGNPPTAIKIGMLALTNGQSPEAGMNRRLSSIQSSNHELVYVLGVVHFKEGRHPTKDAEDKERELHLQFEKLARFKLGSRGAEWFNVSAELQAAISALAEPPESLGIARTIGQLTT